VSIFGCLGKLAVVLDSRTLKVEDFADLPSPPGIRHWESKLPDDVGMLGNDTVGCCTAVGYVDLEQTWTAEASERWIPRTQEVLSAYGSYSGWTPSDPSSDRGADMLTALKYFRANGVGGRRPPGAFMKLEHRDPDVVKAVINFFGGVYVGAELPVSSQTDLGWTDISSPVGSWGGHCMAGVGYDRGEVTFLTWGRKQRATWQWWTRYVDEAYAIVSPDWLETDGLAPSGLDVEKLNAALKKLAA